MALDPQDVARRADELVHDVPDYPEPGVTFKDITPLLAEGAAFRMVVDHIVSRVDAPVDLVVGMEARGFILGAPVATALGAGFIPARKQGKLPRETVAGAYDLEYGSAVLEVHADTVAQGARVLIVDDVLATGGTAAATVELVQRMGGVVVGLSFLMELSALNGRDRLAGQPLDVLLRY